MNFELMVQPVPSENRFIVPGYFVWCGSVTDGDDGKYYMLYSCWPLADGFDAWPVTSEITVAVSDSPAGPFNHLKVVFPSPDLNVLPSILKKMYPNICTGQPGLTKNRLCHSNYLMQSVEWESCHLSYCRILQDIYTISNDLL